MKQISLEELGLNEDSILERLVSRLEEQLLTDVAYDEDGEEYRPKSKFTRDLEKMIQERLAAAIDQLAEKHVTPHVTRLLEGAVLQKTNSWGEKIGEPVTFTEFMVQRADAWMREEVNYNGKAKGEDNFSWRKKGTRVEYLIDEHLQYHIERAMKEALGNANKSIVEGLKEAVNAKLQQIAVALKVDVTSK